VKGAPHVQRARSPTASCSAPSNSQHPPAHDDHISLPCCAGFNGHHTCSDLHLIPAKQHANPPTTATTCALRTCDVTTCCCPGAAVLARSNNRHPPTAAAAGQKMQPMHLIPSTTQNCRASPISIPCTALQPTIPFTPSNLAHAAPAPLNCTLDCHRSVSAHHNCVSGWRPTGLPSSGHPQGRAQVQGYWWRRGSHVSAMH
jgi:hypothetical protein